MEITNKIEKELNLYFDKVSTARNSIDLSEIENLMKSLVRTKKENRNVYVVGNGGSASTSQHFCADIGVGSYMRNNPIKVQSLNDNVSAITAVSNDSKFENVFSTQLSLLATKGDILILFSASGNSANLISAVESANLIGMETFAFLGFDGGVLKDLVKHSIVVSTEIGEYGVVEDIHLSLCHFITDYIRKLDLT